MLRSFPKSTVKLAERLLSLESEQSRSAPSVFEGSNIIAFPLCVNQQEKHQTSFPTLIAFEILKNEIVSTAFTMCAAIGVIAGAYGCFHKQVDLVSDAGLFSAGTFAAMWRQQHQRVGYQALLHYTNAAALTADSLGQDPVSAQKYIMKAVVNAHTDHLRL